MPPPGREGWPAANAAKLANMRQGERTDFSPIGEKSISQERVAEPLNVGKRSVESTPEKFSMKALKSCAPLSSGVPSLQLP